jgi:hypothetical protein
MIALLLALQTLPPAPEALLPGAIGRQALPTKGCAAYLWSRGPTPVLVAMAVADPASARLAIGGTAKDFARVTASGGEAGFGFAKLTEYRLGDVTATIDLTIATRPDLTGGGVVTDATLTVMRGGGDTLVVPIGGLIGCR